MAVSKRLRFEVLRRDGFRCYYCGTRGNETGDGLTIDHVVPVALGGTDDAENLVSACGDCNSGKTSTSPDSELIAQVDQAIAIQQAARVRAIETLRADLLAEQDYRNEVWGMWDTNAPSYAHRHSNDLDAYVDTWIKDGAPLELVEKAFRIAFGNRDVPIHSKIAYAGGVIRNAIRDAMDGGGR